MRKTLIVMIIITLMITMLTGCFGPGAQDYEYEVGTGYKLHRISGHNIVVAPDGNWNEKPVIEAKVVQIAWDERYVIAKQLGLKRAYPDNPNNTYKIPDANVVKYFILDTVELKLYGGYGFDELLEQRKILEISDDLVLKDVNSYANTKK